MPNKEWTDEEVNAAIADAVRIVREDKFEAFVRGRVGTNSTNADGSNTSANDQGNGNSSDSGNGAPKAKKSLWWGDTE